MDKPIKIFHITNPFLEIFLPTALRQTNNISANSIHQKMHAYFFLTFIQCEYFTHFSYYKSLQIHKNNNCGYPIVCLTYEASGLRLYGMWCCWILEQHKRLRWNCLSLAILMYNNVFFSIWEFLQVVIESTINYFFYWIFCNPNS